MQKITPTDTLIVFDLDDCLAQTTKLFLDYLTKHFSEVYGKPYAETNALCLKSYYEFGCAIKYIAKQEGFDQTWVNNTCADMGYVIVDNLHKHMHPCGVMINAISHLKENGCTPAILTQGRKDYAHAIAAHIEIEEFFNPNLIMGHDCVGFTSKRTQAPYKALLSRLTHKPKTCIMLEDTPANLVPARDLGFKTVLVGPKAEPTPKNQQLLKQLDLTPDLSVPHINQALTELPKIIDHLNA